MADMIKTHNAYNLSYNNIILYFQKSLKDNHAVSYLDIIILN